MNANLKNTKISRLKTALLFFGIVIAIVVSLSTDIFSSNDSLIPVKDTTNNSSSVPSQIDYQDASKVSIASIRPIQQLAKVFERHITSRR